MLLPLTPLTVDANFDLVPPEEAEANLDAATYFAWTFAQQKSYAQRRDVFRHWRTLRDLKMTTLAWNVEAWSVPMYLRGADRETYWFIVRDEPFGTEAFVVDQSTLFVSDEFAASRAFEELQKVHATDTQRTVANYARQFGLMSELEFRQLLDIGTEVPFEVAKNVYGRKILGKVGLVAKDRWLVDGLYVYLQPEASEAAWDSVFKMLTEFPDVGASPNDPLPREWPQDPREPYVSPEERYRRLAYMRLPRLAQYWRHRFEETRPGWMQAYPPFEQRPLFTNYPRR